MPTTKLWRKDASRILPAGDPLAKLMARAMVLMNDTILEVAGIGSDTEEGFSGVNQLGEFYRRMYFFRGSVRTLSSGKLLLDQLRKNTTFLEWLAEAELEKQFTDAKGAFDKARPEIDHLRNTIGAHAEKDIGEAVDHLEPGYRGDIEFHSEDGLRFRIAEIILVKTMLPGTRHSDWGHEFGRAITRIRSATNDLGMALRIFVDLYSKRYDVYPH